MTTTYAAGVVALALAGSAAVVFGQGDAPSTSSVETGGQFNLNIVSQPLGRALNEFGKQSGLHVVIDSELVRGMMSKSVRGRYAADAALNLLLADTGLHYRFVDGQTVAIVKATTASQASNADPSPTGEVQLARSDSPAPRLRAQAVMEDEKNATDSGSEIQEVVVTAQKRRERLIDTPQSVSVLSADALARMGATQFRDFADTVPGLSFQTTGAGSTQVTLRGVTAGFDVGPAVGVYVDEVPYGSSSAFALGAQQALDVGLFDVDRIEVLRGPQGTLYGASTMGGLIKYVSKEPDTGRFGIDARLGSAGTQDGGIGYNGAAVVNAPLVSGKAALRASGFYSRDGGYVDNLARNDSDADTAQIYGGRLDLLFKPTDALNIRIGGFLQNVSRDGQSTIEFVPAGGPQFGELEQFRRFPEPSDQRFRLVSSALTYDFGPTALTSISSYQTAESEGSWDISGVYVPLLQAFLGRSYSAVRYPQQTRTHKFTQEVRLAAEASRPLEWVIGGFYTRETSRWDEEFVLFDLAGNPAPNDLYTFGAPSRYEEYAMFGDLTWHLTDKFNVTGGLRHANNRQVFTQFGSGRFIGNRPTGRSDENINTYLANMRYHFSAHAMAYLRYATGYRPGGPNAAANDPITGDPLGSPTFEADRLKSYEIGFKHESADRRFVIDLAAYDIDWDNMQILTQIGGFAFRVNGSGGASVQGAELSLSARPISAFRVTAALAWQDAELSEAEPTLGPPIIGALKGERLPNVPRFSAAMNADYELAMGNWEPTIGATLRHTGERTTGFGPGVHRLPEYTTLDLRAGATLGTVSAQLYVRNVFDKRGQLSLMFPQFGTRVAMLQPLTVGVNLTTQF